MTKENSPLTILIKDNVELLQQLTAFIQQQSVPIYHLPNTQLHSGSVGAHVRHIVDHYTSLFGQTHIVNYDNRSRDPELEVDPELAVQALQNISTRIANIKIDKAVDVVVCTGLDHESSEVQSSLARELCFVHSHTTHHMAIIRLLAIHNNVRLPSDFGKAASTQKYEKNV